MDDMLNGFHFSKWTSNDYCIGKNVAEKVSVFDTPTIAEELTLLKSSSLDCIEVNNRNVTHTETAKNDSCVQSHTVSVPESDNSIKLNDHPDIDEILTADRSAIKATPHNVSVLNAACQKLLKEIETLLLHRLKTNRKEQEIITHYLNSNMKTQSRGSESNKVNIKCLGIPYFKDAEGFPAPKNADVERKIISGKLLPVDFLSNSAAWKYKDSITLVNSVQETFKGKSSTTEIDPNQVDWMKISATNLDGKFSPSECRAKWLLNLAPAINKSPWSKVEITKLKMLAQKHKYQNWEEIAVELGTNRTGFQCCVQSLTHGYSSGDRWTQEEDQALIQLVQNFKVKDHIPWKKIAWNFEGRSLRQCQERFTYSLQNIKKGPFTKEEDFVLIYLYLKLKSFRRVAKFFPKRVSTQIRSRYYYLVKLIMPEFTKEEDKLLTELMIKYPRNWEKISEHFENRSRLQCRGRWADIEKGIKLETDPSQSETDNDLDLGEYNSTGNIDKSDEKIMKNQVTRYSSSNGKSKKHSKTFSAEYTKLLEYCKCGYKFLLGPKPKVPQSENERTKLCNAMKVVMKNLSVSSTSCLANVNVNSLGDNCEFDAEDTLILGELQKSGLGQSGGNVERCDRILPPNYTTLVGLRTLLMRTDNLNELPEYTNYTLESEPCQGVPNGGDSILFTDSKKLFKSRMKSLFAFPFILKNVARTEASTVEVKRKKVKRPNPLSQRKKRNHGRMMLEVRRKLREALNNGTLKSDCMETNDGNVDEPSSKGKRTRLKTPNGSGENTQGDAIGVKRTRSTSKLESSMNGSRRTKKMKV